MSSVSQTGGEVLPYAPDPSFKYIRFNSSASGKLTVTSPMQVDVLVVAGGGGGGGTYGSGGGGGGVLYSQSVTLSTGEYSVSVGGGGAGGVGYVCGVHGGNSQVATGGTPLFLAYGGSGGGAYMCAEAVSSDGRSGGGGGVDTSFPPPNVNVGTRPGGTGVSGQGTSGCASYSLFNRPAGTWSGYGGGGGGAASSGCSTRHGGAGRYTNITGDLISYGDGGGGMGKGTPYAYVYGLGGNGNGGVGYWESQYPTRGVAGTHSGTPSTGGGGGGGIWYPYYEGGSGGSGVVIFRVPAAALVSSPIAVCYIGYYAVNLTVCVECPIGSICATTGLTTPTPCPAGTYGTGVGRTSAEGCTACGAGTYSTSLGLTAAQS